MTKHLRGPTHVDLVSKTARWRFWDLSPEQSFGVRWGEDFVRSRILQEYLSAGDYNVLVFLHSWGIEKNPPKGIHRVDPTKVDTYRNEISLCAPSDEHVVKLMLGFINPEPEGYPFSAAAVVNVRFLRREAERRFKDGGKTIQDRLTVKEAGQAWFDLGVDTKAVIQTWMRRTKRRDKEAGPIFTPVDLAKPSDSRGSRLDLADVVTVGLIHWLLRHGGRYSDFEGPWTRLE